MMFILLVLVLLVVGVFSKAKTWTRRFDIALDIFTLTLFSKVYGVTISSACALALRAEPNGTTILHKLGRLLNKVNPGHCEAALVADAERLSLALAYINSVAAPKPA